MVELLQTLKQLVLFLQADAINCNLEMAAISAKQQKFSTVTIKGFFFILLKI